MLSIFIVIRFKLFKFDSKFKFTVLGIQIFHFYKWKKERGKFKIACWVQLFVIAYHSNFLSYFTAQKKIRVKNEHRIWNKCSQKSSKLSWCLFYRRKWVGWENMMFDTSRANIFGHQKWVIGPFWWWEHRERKLTALKIPSASKELSISSLNLQKGEVTIRMKYWRFRKIILMLINEQTKNDWIWSEIWTFHGSNLAWAENQRSLNFD